MLHDYSDVKQMLGKTPLKQYAAGPVSYAIAAVTRSIPSYFIRAVPHCRIVNTGAEARRIGVKGGILGQPIPEGETLYEGPARIVALSTIPYYGFGFRMFPFAEEQPDRRAVRFSFEDTGPDLGHVRFVALSGEFRLPRPTAAEVGQEIFDRQLETRRAAVDDAQVAGAVADPGGGDAKELAERVACHERDYSGSRPAASCGREAASR